MNHSPKRKPNTNNDRKPLGYIQLPDSGLVRIDPMHDTFLNYAFERMENWNIPKGIVNILSEEYERVSTNKEHKIPYITGDVIVETQYQFFLDSTNGKNAPTSRKQDIKISQIGDDNNDHVYVEFQNRSVTRPFLGDRALQYFGLGIGHNQEHKADQIWLLAEVSHDIDAKLLNGAIFTNYIMKNENNTAFPNSSSITLVNLEKLSEQKNKAGELAVILLGKEVAVTHPEVEQIQNGLNKTFEIFKIDKEVQKMLTLQERAREQGFEDGREQGLEDGMEIAAKLISKLRNVSIEDAYTMIVNEHKEKSSQPAITERIQNILSNREQEQPESLQRTNDTPNIKPN